MFQSLFNVVKDVATIVTAPVEVVLDLTAAVTKPVAEVVEGLVEDIKSCTK